MATVYQTFNVGGAVFPSSNFPQYIITQGTNFPVQGLAYDASTAETAEWTFRAINYASGNLTLDIDWYADTATSGNVVWGAAIGAITPSSDTTNIETKAFTTANTATGACSGSTQALTRTSITISNLDSLAQDDWVVIKIYRDAASGSDTMTGDAIAVLATLSYTSV